MWHAGWSSQSHGETVPCRGSVVAPELVVVTRRVVDHVIWTAREAQAKKEEL